MPIQNHDELRAFHNHERMNRTASTTGMFKHLLMRKWSNTGQLAVRFCDHLNEPSSIPCSPSRKQFMAPPIKASIPVLDGKPVVLSVVCRQYVYDILYNTLVDLVHVYANESVNRRLNFATAACCITAFGVQVTGRLRFRTTIAIAQLGDVVLGLKFLQCHPNSSKAVIPCDSRIALICLQNASRTTLLANKVLISCRTVIASGWTLHLHRIPSHVGVPSNEIVEKLAATTHGDDSPTMRVYRFLSLQFPIALCRDLSPYREGRFLACWPMRLLFVCYCFS